MHIPIWLFFTGLIGLPVLGAIGWQLIRSNNKPIADKVDSDTQKLKGL